MTDQIQKLDSAVKRELDRFKLVERVPELRREAAQLAGNGYELVLKLPRHPAVIAYVNEQAKVVRDDCDLKTARRNLKAARVNYEKRVSFRIRGDITITSDEERGRYADFAAFVSLSAIIEDRAEAKHWNKIMVR